MKRFVVAYVKVGEESKPSVYFNRKDIVGYFSKNKLMTTKLSEAFECGVDGPSIAAQNEATELLRGPHPFDHHGQIFTALIEIEDK